jgi:hypothetical protein
MLYQAQRIINCILLVILCILIFKKEKQE